MPSWFKYNGVLYEPLDPTSYTLVGPTPTTCAGANRVCALYVNNVGGYPDLTCNLKEEIIYALNTRSDIPGKILLGP